MSTTSADRPRRLDKNLYSTFSVAPRLGFAWDVSGKGNSVLKGFYGQMYDGAIFQSWARAVPGLTPNYVYLVGRRLETLTVDSATKRDYAVKDDVKQPRVDEFNVSYEQLIGRNFKLTVTGIKQRLQELRQQRAAGGDVVAVRVHQPDDPAADDAVQVGEPVRLPCGEHLERRHGRATTSRAAGRSRVLRPTGRTAG